MVEGNFIDAFRRVRGVGRGVGVTARGMGDASEGSDESRVFLCTKSRETDAFGRAVWVRDDDETGHCVDARGVNCETDGFLFFFVSFV